MKAALALVLMLAVVALAEPITVTIDPSGGMNPAVGGYSGDPNTIILSKNMYTVGLSKSRQMRPGLKRINDSVPDKNSGVDAKVIYEPSNDSNGVVFCSGGLWYFGATGVQAHYDKHEGYTYDTVFVPGVITPYPEGDSIFVDSSSADYGGNTVAAIYGRGTHFTRYILPGDTIIMANDSIDTGIVAYVWGDTVLELSARTKSGNDTLNAGGWSFRRAYDPTVTPFLLSVGDEVVTGSIADQPQYIFTDPDSAVRIAPGGIVDSFLIDSVIYLFNDTLLKNYTVQDLSNVAGANDDTVVTSVVLVSRAKSAEWGLRNFAQSSNGLNSYYVRLGKGRTSAAAFYGHKYFTILDNNDSAIFIGALNFSAAAQATLGYTLKDLNGLGSFGTLAQGTWGYIYASAGVPKTIRDDDDTPTATIRYGGAIWSVNDATFASGVDVDSLKAAGLLFLQITDQNFTTPAIDTGIIWSKTTYRVVHCGEPAPTTPAGWVLVTTLLGDGHTGSCLDWYWYVRTDEIVIEGQQAFAIGGLFFPITDIMKGGDTVAFETGVTVDPDGSDITTANWQIVKVELPHWSGMTSWGNPTQLVGWGDTLAPSRVSMSNTVSDALFDFNIGSDIIASDKSSNPVMVMLGYDDQLIIGLRWSIASFVDGVFGEITQDIGVVSRNAMYGSNKEVFFVSDLGVYQLARRSLSAHAVTPISQNLDPVFQALDPTQYGRMRVPFYVNPAATDKIVLGYNRRDDHLVLSFPQGTDTENSATITRNQRTGKWDGYFDFGIATMASGVLGDTNRFLMGSPDSAFVFAFSDAYADFNSGLPTGLLQSGWFWMNDQSGFPIMTRLVKMRVAVRGDGYSLDSAVMHVIGDRGVSNLTTTESFDIEPIAIFDITDSVRTRARTFNLWSQKNLAAVFWGWEIRPVGAPATTDALSAIFEVEHMYLQFEPVGKDDK